MEDKWYQNYYKTQNIGSLRQEIEEILNIKVDNKIISIYPTTLKRIRKRHPHAYREYMKKLPEILECPDYVGIELAYPIRLEFIKEYKQFLLVALKLDTEGRLYVSTMYVIDRNKIEKRLALGKIYKLSLKQREKKKKLKYKNTMAQK